MNKKTQHTNSTTDISRQDRAPTGKDLPLFDHLDNLSNTPGSARLIRFHHRCVQRSSLDLLLETDESNRQIIKVVDSARKDILREIPYSDLQYLIQANLAAQTLQTNGCKRISGIEVALPMHSTLEIL